MLNPPEAYEYIWSLYKHVLKRQPTRGELAQWIEKAVQGGAPEDIFEAFVTCEEYRERVAATRVTSKFPPGHFYSPIVDPSEARKYVRTVNGGEMDIPGVKIPLSRMRVFWDAAIPFVETTAVDGEGGSGPERGCAYGDAVMIRAMVGRYRPARAIEVGPGVSSACVLEAARDAGIADFSLTCIDREPEGVRSVLGTADGERVRILGTPVQEVPIELFGALGPGDLLLIDSTHVLKTGSDVCDELFRILPSLAKGVIVHFRDCRYPFEYPEEWIFDDNRSWNEAYAVRAFLMYNSDFEILFWNSLFAIGFKDRIAATVPAFLGDPGGGLWIERVARRAASGMREG
jgi:Methyltransferase domain